MMRPPAVAGSFYPARPEVVLAEATRLVSGDSQSAAPTQAIAVVCPHAGWRYSGALAGRLLQTIAVPQRVLVLAPNHTGRGTRASIWPDGAWRLPGLDVPVDAPLVQQLLARAPVLEPDHDAHLDEHAIEVLLPLLGARQPALHLTAAVLGGLSWQECEALGAAIAQVVAAQAPVLIVASSDMNHYLSDEETRTIDQKALDPLLALDPRGLWNAVRAHGITMCGYIPTTVALIAANALGATKATLVGHTTSADAGGDRERVVGYAAITIAK
jgi:AmmeMemoRadiSam system protein B